MNRLSIISELIQRIKVDRSMRNAYRWAFNSTACWKTERRLAVLLCAGIGLMVIVAGLQIKAMFFGTEKYASQSFSKNIPPPPLLKVTVTTQQSLPEVSLTVSRTHTLFQLVKQVVDPITSAKHAVLETRAYKAESPARHMWHMQLQIQRSPASEVLIFGAMAEAGKYLQSGDVELARQAYLAVLTQDAHNVEAMEGMLGAARQLRDIQSEEIYLERLRQEIPYYDEGNVLGNNVSLVNIQHSYVDDYR